MADAEAPRVVLEDGLSIDSPGRCGASRPTLGVVLEGGGMRGMFTAGVLDVWMEHGLTADACVGVSAGAVFGCNFKSRQIGRTIRYNKRFCDDKRYASWGNWLRTGDLYSRNFAYHDVPWKYDVFDTATYAANPMRFWAVCTDIEAGRPVYQELSQGDEGDVEWLRASASIPVLARPVELDGKRLLDGGVADPIPFAWMLEQGCDRMVVVLTQPAGYRKEPMGLMPLLRVALRKYPRLVGLLADRHERYNASLDELARRERAGEVLIIRPSESVKAPSMVRDPEVLERIYQVGRADGEATLGRLQAYLS